jgi:hypothetical protein
MKTVNQDAVNFLNDLRKDAVAKEIRVTQAYHLLIKKIPDITRPEIAHSAEAAGLKGLTARNVWDKVNKDIK